MLPLVRQIAECVENGGGVCGNQAVFEYAVVAGVIDYAFAAHFGQMVGNDCCWQLEGLGQFVDVAVAIEQGKQNLHAFWLGNQSEQGGEVVVFHSVGGAADVFVGTDNCALNGTVFIAGLPEMRSNSKAAYKVWVGRPAVFQQFGRHFLRAKVWQRCIILCSMTMLMGYVGVRTVWFLFFAYYLWPAWG